MLLAAALAIAYSSFTVVLDPVEPWLESQIASRVDPLRVRRGDLRLSWGGLRTPVLVRAERWALLRADGEPLLDLPRVDVGLEPRALVRGKAQPIWVTVSSPRLSLDRDAQGVFAPSADDLAALSKTESSGTSSLLDAWRSPPASGPLARLEWVRIEEGTVAVRDRALALDWGIKDLEAELSREHVETIDLAGSFEAANAETRAEVSFDGAFELERRRLGLALELADAELEQIARLHSALASLAQLDLSLAADARVTVDASGLVADPIEIRLTGEREQAPAVVRGDARWAKATKTLSAAASTQGFDLSLLAPLAAPISERLAAGAPVPALNADVDFEAGPERRTLRATVRASTDEAPFSTLIATLDQVPGQSRERPRDRDRDPASLAPRCGRREAGAPERRRDRSRRQRAWQRVERRDRAHRLARR